MAQSTKIMLVEDDNNLGEIYMARMAAEGYSVVVAHDGEEALALAAKEKPDLIISDVMMPKISGFEMLDILRNTPGLRDTKVIMLTALGQAEDKTRAQSLGADRYLVKSQVTLEDIVENARALLSGDTATATAAEPAAGPQAAAQPVQAATPAPEPVAQIIAPAQTAAPVAAPIPVAAPPDTSSAPAPVPVADPPAPIAVAPEPAPIPASSLAQPLNTNPVAANDAPQTSSIADIVAASEPVQPASAAPAPAPALPDSQTPAPAPQTADQPSAPEPPKSEAAVNESNDKVLTGAVDELLANAPKAAPAPAAAPVPAANTASPENKPSEHTAKILDDGGNELAVGDTASTRVSGKKVIAPISDVSKKPDLNALLANEEAKAAGPDSNPVAPGITTSTNGVQTTVVMPSNNNITDVSAPTEVGALQAPANLQEPPVPGQNNPNVTNPASANAPGANFDPSSVAL